MQRSSEALTIGQRLELGFGHEQVVWLPSRLEDTDGDLLLVAWPTDHTRRLIPVALGTTLQLSAPTRDAIYSATVVVQRVSRSGVPLLTVEVRGAWQRTQRRNAVRISVAVRPRVANVVDAEHSSRPLRLAVTNLSASGVRVRSQDELRQGDLLELAFELMGVEGEIRAQARVRRVQRYERVWDAGCEFEGIPERLAQRIVQFIFAQQRLRAQTGRGGR